MRKIIPANPFFKLTLLFTLTLNVTAFSQVKPAITSTGGSIRLFYHYPADKPVKYLYITKVIQNMEVNGESILVNTATYLKCSVRSSDNMRENLKLEIRLDTMANNVETPQGVTGGEITEARDKVFNIVIKPSGKIIDLSEAAKIVLSPPGRRESNASETFLNYFPLLPSDLITKGDTWIIRDTINTKSQTMSRWMPLESNYKFEGIENLNGFACAKISATISGSLKMVTQTQGMDVNTSGIYSGIKTLYFAVKEGFFVKEIISSKMTGKVEISDQNRSIPVVMDIMSTNELIKPF